MEDEFWYKKRREARAAALKKELDERNARIKRSLFYYIKQEFNKTWEAYVIIAGGTFMGIIMLILWITYLNWDFRSTYSSFFDLSK
tara:strand:+ start:439 stop:696 length:258 start_codon:yes stop_codon:yes gene_type:complete